MNQGLASPAGQAGDIDIAAVQAEGFRRLHFPDALESGYRHYNTRRSVDIIRRVMPWVTPFWVIAAAILAFAGEGEAATTWIRHALLPVGAAIAWLRIAILTGWLERSVQLHIGLAMVLAQAATLRTVFLLGDDPFALYVILQSIYLLVILFTLTHLRLTTAALCALLPALLALLAAAFERLPVAWMEFLQFYGNTMMLGIVIGYVLEYRERSAWLTTRQRAREVEELLRLRADTEAAGRRQQLLGDYLQRIGGNPTPTEIAGRTLTFLVEHCHAQVGTVYLLRGERLRRAASCGLDGESRLAEDLGRGETLIGQAALNRRRLRLFHLPEDYCPIRTATGSTRPAELLIEPVHRADQTLAVIELGGLHRFSDDAVGLVDELAPAMAAALVAAMARDAMANADFDVLAVDDDRAGHLL